MSLMYVIISIFLISGAKRIVIMWVKETGKAFNPQNLRLYFIVYFQQQNEQLFEFLVLKQPVGILWRG